MSQLLRSALPLFALSFNPLVVWAHPGHGDPGPAHYVSEPVHLMPMVTIAVLLLLVVSSIAGVNRYAKRRRLGA